MPSDDDQQIVVTPEEHDALSVPEPTIADVWDMALTGVLSENSRRAYKQAMVNFGLLPARQGRAPRPHRKSSKSSGQRHRFCHLSASNTSSSTARRSESKGCPTPPST